MVNLSKISFMSCLEIECNDDCRFNGLEALRDDIRYFDSNRKKEMEEKRRLAEEIIRTKGLETLRRYESEKGIKLSFNNIYLLIKYIFPLELPFRSQWRVKDPVVDLLRTNKTARDVALYIIRRKNDLSLKRGVIIAIGQAGCEEGLELLVNCLDNEETDYEAIMALGYMGDSRARNALVNMLDRSQNEYRFRPLIAGHRVCSAIKYLGKINDKETVQSLLKFLEQKKQAEKAPSPIAYKIDYKMQRGECRKAYKKWREECIKAYKKQREEDRKAGFRREVVQTLGEMKAKSAESNLIALLSDRDKYVVGETATALAKIESKSSVNNLLACLEKENCPPQVAYALGELGDNSILDNLASALMRSYKTIEFETNIWARESNENRREHACELSKELIDSMKKIHEDRSYALLLEYLNHEKYSGYAAWALREFGSRSIKPLISCLSGLIRPKTVRYAIESLRQLNAKEALPDLEALLYSPMVYDGCNDSKERISDLARESIEEILIGKSIRQILQEGDYDYFDKLKAGRAK